MFLDRNAVGVARSSLNPRLLWLVMAPPSAERFAILGGRHGCFFLLHLIPKEIGAVLALRILITYPCILFS
jgi:hypothetical protein